MTSQFDPRTATEDDASTTGFYWWTPFAGSYHVCLLRESLKRQKGESLETFRSRQCFELSADSPEDLRELMLSFGWDEEADHIKNLCESSPKGPISRRLGK